MPVIRREYFNRWYSLKAYFFASSIADIPCHVSTNEMGIYDEMNQLSDAVIFGACLQVTCVTVFMTIIFWLTNQPFEWFRFGMSVFVIILVSLIFQDYGIMMGTLLDMQVNYTCIEFANGSMSIRSSVLRSYFGLLQTGLIAAMFTTFPIVMFSGFLLFRKDAPEGYHYFFDASPLRRAVELVVASVYGFDRKPLACPKVRFDIALFY